MLLAGWKERGGYLPAVIDKQFAAVMVFYFAVGRALHRAETKAGNEFSGICF